MSGEALGLIETIGLAAAVEAADTAVKSANVTLAGYELTRGDGMITVKITGDVGAVQAAVQAAAESAGKVSKIWAAHIIPRPHRETESLIRTPETVGLSHMAISEEQSIPDVFDKDIGLIPPMPLDEVKIAADKIEAQKTTAEQFISVAEREPVNEIEPTVDIDSSLLKDEHESCNLCSDPECPRKKGDPKVLCIHYKKKSKED
ncbi:MAG: hypothetical protein H6Q73_3114 [Firmicutes bacterium]|nr:hypothetical protein [Bacillota bacterium]